MYVGKATVIIVLQIIAATNANVSKLIIIFAPIHVSTHLNEFLKNVKGINIIIYDNKSNNGFGC